VWQRERLQGEELERELSFWRKELNGAPRVLELNVARGQRQGQNNRGATERLSISQELTREIKETSRREGVTLFMFLLTSFYVLLHYYSKREDIVVGVDVANRNQGGTEGLIGLFVNQIMMRADLSGKPNFQELLARVSTMTLRVYAHQDLPFDKLVDSLKLERQLGRNPLFQVMFGLQNLPRWSKDLPGLALTPLRVDTETTIFDLSLYMAEMDQRFIGWMRYSTDLFTSEIVNRMVGQYQAILQKVVAEPAVTLQALHDLLAASDQKLQLSKQSESRETSHRMLATVRPQPIKGVLIPEIQ
jgi:non-ribosomal peptide synthetase component F